VSRGPRTQKQMRREIEVLATYHGITPRVPRQREAAAAVLRDLRAMGDPPRGAKRTWMKGGWRRAEMR
jgi:hypothetical protein